MQKIDLGNKHQTIAVVGATQNKDKWGYKVLMRLKELGFEKVVGVNPKYDEIEGVVCVGSLDLVDPVPDMVVTVVPPEVSEQVVDKCIELVIGAVWMQPGSESEAAVEKAAQAGLEVASGACIVVDGLGEGWGDLG